jgi:hypothetical protein
MNVRVVAYAVCALLAAGANRAVETVSFESLDADLTGGKATKIQAVASARAAPSACRGRVAPRAARCAWR